MSTLVERLEAEAVKEMDCGFDTVHSLLLREAAAALHATGEGEWPGQPDPVVEWEGKSCKVSRHLYLLTGDRDRARALANYFEGVAERQKHVLRKLRAAAPTPAEPLRGESRFFIDHGMVHDRKTGKHVGDNAADLLALLQRLENERDAWRYTAKAVNVTAALAAAAPPTNPLERERLNFITMVPEDRTHKLLVERGWAPPAVSPPTNPGEISSKVVDASQQFHHDECQCVECDDGNPETNRHAAPQAPVGGVDELIEAARDVLDLRNVDVLLSLGKARVLELEGRYSATKTVDMQAQAMARLDAALARVVKENG